MDRRGWQAVRSPPQCGNLKRTLNPGSQTREGAWTEKGLWRKGDSDFGEGAQPGDQLLMVSML